MAEGGDLCRQEEDGQAGSVLDTPHLDSAAVDAIVARVLQRLGRDGNQAGTSTESSGGSSNRESAGGERLYYILAGGGRRLQGIISKS